MDENMWNKEVPHDERDKALDNLVPGWRDMPLDKVKAALLEQQQEIAGIIELLGVEPEEPSKPKHWLMQYADRERFGDTGRYIVAPEDPQRPGTAFTDTTKKRLQFDRKSAAITEAQRRNGYEPVNGSEQTYAEQLKADGRR